MSMYTRLGFAAIVLLLPALQVNAAEWHWSAAFGAEQPLSWLSDRAHDVAVGADGFVHVTGTINGHGVFGPTEFVSEGVQDMFVAKLDPTTGTPIWIRHAGHPSANAGEAAGRAIAVDADGNAYVTGYFSGRTTFGKTGSPDDLLHYPVTLSSVGSRDIFVAKYDPLGRLMWVVRAGGSGADEGLAMALDDEGQPYIAGYVGQGLAGFGNGHSVQGMAPVHARTFFIAKYDGATGLVAWVGQASHADQAAHSAGHGIAIDPMGNAYVAGHFSRHTLLGPGVVLDSAQPGDENIDGFVAKYDSSGQPVWARQTIQSDSGASATELFHAVAVDARANVYVGGYMQSSVYVGNIYLSPMSGTDMLLAKYDASGEVIWAHNAPSAIVYALDTTASGELFIAGCYENHTHLPAQDDPIELSHKGGHVFAGRLDAMTGEGLWGLSTSGDIAAAPYEDCASGIAVDISAAAAYVSGYFHRTALFGDSNQPLEAKGALPVTADGFVARLGMDQP